MALLARTANFSLRCLRFGHGSTLPGRLARCLVPDLLPRLSALPHLRFILVSGTNGKTTTAHILHYLLRRAGWRAESNTSGANLESGLITTILTRVPLCGGADTPIAFVLEIDEAALARLADCLHPQVVILTNFCRDQLDRYGELDHIASRIGGALARLGPGLPAVLNADDPGVAGLSTGQLAATFYGLEAEAAACDWSSPLEHYSCSTCQADLAYHHTYLGHYGDWYCPSCGRGRPERQAAATRIILDTGTDGSSFHLRLGKDEAEICLPLLGLHNIYNALAAAEAAARLGLRLSEIAPSLAGVTPCFGRGERQRAGQREIHLFLIKNPAGANAVLETIARKKAGHLWFVINDRIADGRDVSWLWDVDFEGFWEHNGHPGHVVISGRRALDLAVRFRYSALPPERMLVMPRIKHGLRHVSCQPTKETCYVLATYTALLDLRDRLSKAKRW